MYTSEVNDAWYAAHRFLDNLNYGGGVGNENGKVQTYISDEPGSPLACKVHYQACNPNPEGLPTQVCPVSGGLYDTGMPGNLPPGSEGNDILPWMFDSFGDIGEVIATLATSSLTSKFSLSTGLQGPLPDDQWQAEVEFWHNIVVTSLQSIADGAIGPGDPEILKYFWRAPDSFQRQKLCNNQVRTGHSLHDLTILYIMSNTLLCDVNILASCYLCRAYICTLSFVVILF